MDVVVTGRNVEVPEHFKVHASDKLARAERYDAKLARVDVELAHERNPRQTKTKQRVQLTVAGRGPVIRAEASAETFYAALDLAIEKLEGRLRKARGRRLDRITSRAPIGEVAAAVGGGAVASVDGESGETEEMEGPGRVVRIKNHPADPISVDQALLQMELVGHDFYLFNDVESGLASVVYRRKGFDYGLLRLG
jgi:ribosomal subunit interface protein